MQKASTMSTKALGASYVVSLLIAKAKKPQLVAFVRYVDNDDISEHILFCKTLEGKTTGEDIF